LGLGLAKCNLGAADANVEWARKAGASQQFDALADAKAQGCQSLMQSFLGVDGVYGGPFTGLQVGEAVSKHEVVNMHF
jgi:hypothetical protein